MARRSSARAAAPSRRVEEWSSEARLAEYRELLGDDAEGVATPAPSPTRPRTGRRFGPLGWVVGAAAGILFVRVLFGVLMGFPDGRFDAYAAGEPAAAFESVEDGFAAEFPADPVRVDHPPFHEMPEVQMVGYEVRLGEGFLGGTDQIVAVTVGSPLDVSAIGDPERVLWYGVKGGATSVEGTIESTSYRVVDGRPTTDFTIAADRGSIRGRALVAGDRIFVLEVVAEEGRYPAFSRLAETFRVL